MQLQQLHSNCRVSRRCGGPQIAPAGFSSQVHEDTRDTGPRGVAHRLSHCSQCVQGILVEKNSQIFAQLDQMKAVWRRLRRFCDLHKRRLFLCVKSARTHVGFYLPALDFVWSSESRFECHLIRFSKTRLVCGIQHHAQQNRSDLASSGA